MLSLQCEENIECKSEAGERSKLAEVMDIDQIHVDQHPLSSHFFLHHHQQTTEGPALLTSYIHTSACQMSKVMK